MKVTLKTASPSNKTWKVRGADLQAVGDAMDANGWWGLYTCNPTLKYGFKDDMVDTVTVMAKPSITMPKWPGYMKASKDDKKIWDTMWKALKKHELSHHTVYQNASSAWKSGLESGPDVEKKDFLKAWKAFNLDTRKLQDTHDTKTDHGKKQGVTL